MATTRAGFTLRLKPGGLEEYVARHDRIWPELVAEMASHGVEQVTIFHADGRLFIYSEIADPSAWERLWNLDVHLRWAQELEPYLELAADGTPDAEDLTEIFAPAAGRGRPVSVSRSGHCGSRYRGPWVTRSPVETQSDQMASSAVGRPGAGVDGGVPARDRRLQRVVDPAEPARDPRRIVGAQPEHGVDRLVRRVASGLVDPVAPTVGTPRRSGPAASARSRMSAHMSVLTSPGWMTLAVTPVPASSAARWRVNWFSATFAVP